MARQTSCHNLLIVLAILTVSLRSAGAADSVVEIKPVSEELAKEYKLKPEYYRKCALVQDILIATSDKVSDYAILEAAYLFDKVMKTIKPQVAQRIRDKKVLCVLVGHAEHVSDMPQFPSDKTGKELDYYNWRSRGFLSMVEKRFTVLFSEEDVLEYEGGMQIESILIHEFGHVIDKAGFDKELFDRLESAFKNAKAKGLYNDGFAAQRFRRVKSEKPVSLLAALVESFPTQSPELLEKCLNGGDILVNEKPSHSKVEVTKEDKVLIVFGGPKPTYSLANRAEYFAEGVQNWMNTNRTMDHDHNHIHKREQIKEYDPELAKLCEEVLGDTEWRFVSPRTRAGTDHLSGYNPAAAPKVVQFEHIDQAAQDYYDKYWKDYWKRLQEKYAK